MVDLQVTTAIGSGTILQEDRIEQFGSNLLGQLLLSGDAGYDSARQIYNGMIDPKPALHD